MARKFLNAYTRGFQELGSITPTETNRLEWAWRLLSNKAFNSLRCAYQLLQMGYYTQALTLVRSVMEDWLTALDCESHPQTLEALLYGEGKMPPFEDMAKRQGQPVYRLWRGMGPSSEGTYGLLSTVAHPRRRGLGMLLDHEKGLFRLGGQYDADLFAFTCYYLVTGAFCFTEILNRLVGLTNPQSAWLQQLLALLDEASTWKRKMTSWADARMQTKKGGGRAE